eukprot:SAG31_NODE_7_length_42755_cov_130.245728_19_plen_328_part_00
MTILLHCTHCLRSCFVFFRVCGSHLFAGTCRVICCGGFLLNQRLEIELKHARQEAQAQKHHFASELHNQADECRLLKQLAEQQVIEKQTAQKVADEARDAQLRAEEQFSAIAADLAAAQKERDRLAENWASTEASAKALEAGGVQLLAEHEHIKAMLANERQAVAAGEELRLDLEAALAAAEAGHSKLSKDFEKQADEHQATLTHLQQEDTKNREQTATQYAAMVADLRQELLIHQQKSADAATAAAEAADKSLESLERKHNLALVKLQDDSKLQKQRAASSLLAAQNELEAVQAVQLQQAKELSEMKRVRTQHAQELEARIAVSST